MDNKFETLNDETTILMLDQDTFTVARFTKLIQNQLCKRFPVYYNFRDGSQMGIDDYFKELDLFDEEVQISMDHVQLRFPPKGLECKLLNFETTEWQTGKLRMIVDVKIILNESSDKESRNIEINQVTLEFALEQPILEYESYQDQIINSSSE